MTITRKYGTKLLKELICGGDVGDLEELQDEVTHYHDGETFCTLVFKDIRDNTMWKVSYSKGEHLVPFEYEGSTIECMEVEPFQVLKTEYRAKP
mgnify:CR=1 FL=1